MQSIGKNQIGRSEVRITIIKAASIGLIYLSFLSCSQENEGTASPTTQSDNSIASDIEDGKQDQQLIATEPTTTWEEKKARIKAAIVALDNRPNDDAFLSIEDLASHKWLQLLGRPGDPISLYLPLQALNEEETKRAEKYFADLGFSALDYGGNQAYVIDLNHDHERAADVAIDVFKEIYQLSSNFEMQFDEN